MTTIRIPTPLRPFAGGQREIEVPGDTVGTALDNLTAAFPELRQHLYDGDELRSFVNLYLNQDDIRYLQGTETPIGQRDTLMIIPSIAGGR